jgi:uncharacterized membrane protein YfcA
MSPVVFKIVIGFLVGILIGLTGLGGGVLMLPVLIFGLGVPAIIAVGSDALFNFLTKIPAGLFHLRRGTVRRRVVVALALGSIPGSAAGVALLTHLRTLLGAGVNDILRTMVGLLLILIPLLLLFQDRIEDRLAHRPPTMKSFAGMSVIGLVSGFLVGLTSVGSGSIIMLLLLLFYSFAPKVMVGTDIVHAIVLTGVTSFLQFKVGNVDPLLVGSLLVGSVPGGLLGSYLSARIPVLWLRRLLCGILLATGARMLWA